MLLDDGVVTIWAAQNTAQPGELPQNSYTKRVYMSYYGQKKVGLQRFWAAQAHNSRADLLIRIQRCGAISTAHRCKLAPSLDIQTAGWYKILQVQHLLDEDGLPASELTLERIDNIESP